MKNLSANQIIKRLYVNYRHMAMFRTMFAVVLFACSLVDAAVPSWQDFRAEPDLRDHAVSPDGRYMAVLAADGHSTRVTIHDLDAEGYPIIGEMEGSVRRPMGVDWANNDRLLVNVHVPYGTETLLKKKKKGEDLNMRGKLGVYRTVSVDVQAKDLVVLLEEKAHRTRIRNLSAVQNSLADDPEHILMRVFSGKTISLHKVNIYSGESEHLIKGGRNTVGFITDASGKLKFRYDILLRSQIINIYELLPNTKWKKVVAVRLDEDEASALEHEGLVSISKDGELLYRALNESTGFLEIKKLSAQGVAQTFISRENQDVLGLIYNIRGEVSGYTTEADIHRYHYFDPDKQALYDEIVKQALGEGVIMHTNNARRHAVYSFGRDNPGILHVFDEQQNKLITIGHAHERLAKRELGVPAVVRYKTRDNHIIQGYFLFPPGYEKGKRYPAVILPHAGPASRTRGGFDPLAQFIATRGYMVLQPNFRGSTGFGHEFEAAGYKAWGGKMQDDLEDGLKFMVDRGLADPDRICLVGESYGGYAALMGVVKTPDVYRCAISMNGVFDIGGQIKHTRDKRFRYLYDKVKDDAIERLYERLGHPRKDQQYLHANSPVFHAQHIKAPVLLIAGKKDRIVPFKQSKKMAKSLKKYGKTVDFIALPYSGHNIFRSTYSRRRDQLFTEERHSEKAIARVSQSIEKFLSAHLSEGKDTRAVSQTERAYQNRAMP